VIDFTIPLIWVLGLGAGYVAWLFRLEFRVKRSEERHVEFLNALTALTVKHESLDSKVIEELSRIRESLARIEGRLELTKHKRGEK